MKATAIALAFTGSLAVGPAFAQTPTVASPVAGAQVDSLLRSQCTVVNLRATQADAIPLVAASCGKRGAVVGEARSYESAYHVASASLLIVRKGYYGTGVALVFSGGDGGVHVEDLTGDIRQALGKEGRIRSPMFQVDMANFAARGSILVSPVLEIAVKAGITAPNLDRLTIDLTPTLAIAQTAAAGAKTTATGSNK